MRTALFNSGIKISVILIMVFSTFTSQAQANTHDKVDDLKELMQTIVNSSDEELFVMSCQSILNVLNAEDELSSAEITYLEAMYDEFMSGDMDNSPYGFENYLNRKHSLIFAWTSESDGETSFTWLRLPKDWDADKEYPLYVQLHGLWDVAHNAIRYMAYPYTNGPASNYAFEDGYHLSPWGRGNHWYEDFSETDIWECIAEFENQFEVNKKRKYLCGHSMGGYGAWNLAQKTAGVWAAVGIHAGALWWNSGWLVIQEIADNLSETLVYFVVGTNDGLLSVCQQAYALLENTGNSNLEFVTFVGGHEYRSADVERMYDWMSQFENDNPVSNKQNLMREIEIAVAPNPFDNELNIKYQLAERQKVELVVHNCLGQPIAQLVNAHQSAGLYNYSWKPKGLNQGIYYCTITIGKQKTTQRIFYND